MYVNIYSYLTCHKNLLYIQRHIRQYTCHLQGHKLGLGTCCCTVQDTSDYTSHWRIRISRRQCFCHMVQLCHHQLSRNSYYIFRHITDHNGLVYKPDSVHRISYTLVSDTQERKTYCREAYTALHSNLPYKTCIFRNICNEFKENTTYLLNISMYSAIELYIIPYKVPLATQLMHNYAIQ